MYEIIWTDNAEQRYIDELEYWFNRNKSYEYPLTIIAETDKIETFISDNPYIGRPAKTENVRVVSALRKFLIYCEIIDDAIIIVDFINSNTNSRFIFIYYSQP